MDKELIYTKIFLEKFFKDYLIDCVIDEIKENQFQVIVKNLNQVKKFKKCAQALTKFRLYKNNKLQNNHLLVLNTKG